MYPNTGQLALMQEHCRQARFVYNIGLEQRSLWRDFRGTSQPPIIATTQQKQLAEARAEYPWLRAGSSVVQQGALRDLDRAFENWWRNPSHFARPTWRRAGVSEGFVVRDLSVKHLNRRWSQVLAPKVGWVRFRRTRTRGELAQASSARVTLDSSGRWHVSLVAAPPDRPRAATGQVVGIDRGVANTIATTGEVMLTAPSLSAGEQARFVALQQRLSRQRKGSNRRGKTRSALARMHARISDRRRDWVEKTTTDLTRTYDVIAIEDLRTKNMTRRPKPKPDPDRAGMFLPNQARAKAALNRAILASSWGAIERRLHDKAKTTGIAVVVKVSPAHTSQQCHACGHIAPENRESQAVFECVKCGHQEHADINAARNILTRGLTKLHEAAGHAAPGRIRPIFVGSVNQQAA